MRGSVKDQRDRHHTQWDVRGRNWKNRHVNSWRSGTGWSKTSSGWTTSPFLLADHYAIVGNYARYMNPIFCYSLTGVEGALTLSDYPHVRIIVFDDGGASFFDDVSAVGGCSVLLHKEWIHSSEYFFETRLR